MRGKERKRDKEDGWRDRRKEGDTERGREGQTDRQMEGGVCYSHQRGCKGAEEKSNGSLMDVSWLVPIHSSGFIGGVTVSYSEAPLFHTFEIRLSFL